MDPAGPGQGRRLHWLQTLVLINPLIYVNDGMRAAFTDAPHMHLYVIYPVMTASARPSWRSACATSGAASWPEDVALWIVVDYPQIVFVLLRGFSGTCRRGILEHMFDRLG